MADMKDTYFRSLTLDRAKADTEARTIPAALSSETPVQRWFGTEVLLHDKEAIDLSRADGGLPLLWNHDSNQPIGLVKDIRLDADKKLRGLLHFSNNAHAREVWGDVRDGFLKDVSIGYAIREWNEAGDDLVNVQKWSLHEASIAPVPADHSVGVNRNWEGNLVPKDPDQGNEIAQPDDVNVVDFSVTRERNLAEGSQVGARKERERQQEIRRAFNLHLTRGPQIQDMMDTCLDRGTSVQKATEALLKLLAQDHEPISTDYQQDEYNGSLDQRAVKEVRVEAGTDQQEKYNDIVEKALLVRVGTTTDKEIITEVRNSEYADMLVSEMARDFLQRNRISTKGLKRSQLIGQAMSRATISHGASDFANVLENVANKSMLLGYEESPETWPMIARTISVPDFKQNSFVGLSEFGSLPEVKESGEYTYGTFADRKEVATLATFGQLFSISRQALSNDDLGSLGSQPRSMGRAASRTIGDKVYLILTGNPTLNQDATSLFDASGHGNDIAAGSGAAPSVTTLNAARTAMATQKDQSSSTTSLNIRLSRLIVPVALETTANILSAAEKDPAEGGSTAFNAPNPFRGTFQVVADARLDDADPLEWFASADPNVTDTIGACFLNGQTTPYLESQNGFDVDGVVYKVRIDCVAVALDFRGLFRNDGN